MFIYILIAILILAAGIRIIYEERYDIKRVSAVMTVAISLAVTALSWPYFLKTESNILFAAYSAIKYGASAIGMSSRGGITDELALTGGMRSLYSFMLYALYIAGPLFASVFIISFSHSAVEWLRTQRKHKIHIFSQLNENSLITAQSLSEHGLDSMIIFADTEKADEELKTKARAAHAILVEKEETGLHLYRNRDYNFYEINDSHTEALEQTVKLLTKLKDEKKEIQKRISVRCFASFQELDLIREIDRNRPEDIRLRFVDVYRQEAVRLMENLKNDLIRKDSKDIKIGIIGAGMAGTSVLRTAASLLILPETSYQIHVFDYEAKRIAAQLKAECPEILNLPLDAYFVDDDSTEEKNLNICFHQVNANRCEMDEELMNYCADAQALIFATGNDQLNFRTAKRISRLYASHSDTLSVPRIAIRITDPDLRALITDSWSGLLIFGCADENYRYDHLVTPYLEDTAARVHLSYLNSWYPGILEADEKRQEEVLWETGFYSYVNQDSSYAQALATMYRLAYIQTNSSLSPEEYIQDPVHQKLLAETEHERWNMYQRFQGWRYLNHTQEMEVARLLKGKKVKDDRDLLHPALVRTDQLQEAEDYADACMKQFNPASEGSKYILSDYQIIRMLPEILKYRKTAV